MKRFSPDYEKSQWELIASFGKAKLFNNLDGKLELRGGSKEDWIKAHEWIKMFLPNAVVTERSDWRRSMTHKTLIIVSGGQTGADRAALDWAIQNNVRQRGWCPKNRKAEDGPINLRYQLNETPTPDYAQRTELNVRDSDGTVIFSISEQLSGGSLETAQFAQKHKKPLLHLSFASRATAADQLRQFLEQNQTRC